VDGTGRARRQIAGERLTDKAPVAFEDDYLREHITLGYASTLHARGMTIGNSHARP
jgi:hypothetical protein